MKLIDQIINECGPQIPMHELNLLGSIANPTRLRKINAMCDPDEFERLYHEEQAIAAGEYFWLWVRYIEKRIKERNDKINEGHRDEVLPLDEFVRSLHAPPAILCEVFFRLDYCGLDKCYRPSTNYLRDGYYSICWDSGFCWESYWDSGFFELTDSPTIKECTFEDYLRWFTSGVMQFVRTIWEYNYGIPMEVVPNYRFLVAYENRIPEICQAMIDAVKEGKLPPELVSFGFLNKCNTYLQQIQNEKLFQELPARLLMHCTSQGPLEQLPWGDFCCLLPPKVQTQNLPKDAPLSDFCAKCAFPCGEFMTPVVVGYYSEYHWDSLAKSYSKYEEVKSYRSWAKDKWAGWCRCENFAYVKFDYVMSEIQKYEYVCSIGPDENYWEDLGAEEDDRFYYSEYYHPEKRFGRRHHGGGGKTHKIKKTDLEFSDLENRVQTAVKKWNKELEPVVQTASFLANHGMNAQGRDLSSWQNAANWLFEVKEKQIFDVTAKLEMSQMFKLAQLCSRLPWQKLRNLLDEPIRQCKGECVTAYKELIRGAHEPISEGAENMMQNELFAQVYRLAEGWSKIC